MYGIKLDKRHADIVILAIIISITVALVAGMGPAITGFYATAGNEWENRLEVQATSAEQIVATHVLFGTSRPLHCAEGIYVETADGQQIPFKTGDEIYLNGVCIETDVSFGNIIYAQVAPPISYLVYYGKLGAAQTETAQEPAEEPAIVTQEEEKPRPAFGAATFGAAVTFGAKATNTSGCTNITAPDTYTLNVSITNSNNVICMDVRTQNVTFIGSGFIIDGTDAASTTGINVSQNNVSLKDVVLTDWITGIFHINSANGTIENATITSSTAGILLDDGSTGKIIKNSNISNNDGIGVEFQADSNTIENSTISGNTLDGIITNTGPSFIVIRNNIIEKNLRRGIQLASGSSNTVANNIIIGQRNNDGLQIGSSTAGTITNNTIENNRIGINTDTAASFYNNTLQNNTIWDFFSNNNALITIAQYTNISGSFQISWHNLDIALKNASAPAADPTDYKNMSKYLNITNTTGNGAWIFLNFTYDQSEIPAGYNKTNLTIAKYNGTSWTTVVTLFSNSNGRDSISNVVWANITDFAGNSSTDGDTIFALMAGPGADITAPTITYVAPTETAGINISRNSIVVNVTVTDDTDLDLITVRLFNSTSTHNTSTSSASPFFFNFTGLADGTYSFNVTANDTTGNSNSTASRTVIIDTTLPVPSFVAPTPANASTVSVNSLAVNVTVTESNLANITIVLSNSSGIVNTSVSTASPFFLNFTNLAEDVNYTVNATALDTAGNSNFTARVFVINIGDVAAQKAAASTSGSGAGAGGGGGTGAIGEISATVVIGDINAGERKAVLFAGKIDVQKITVEASRQILNAKVTVGEFLMKPEDVPEPAGLVYKYLNINFPEADSAIGKAEVAFRVEKSWLGENNVDKASVALLRYTNKWQKLPTEIKGEDANYVYYSVETPGFSVFAIVGEKKQKAAAPSEVQAPRQPKVSVPVQAPPKRLEIPESIINFSRQAAFLFTPASLIVLAALTAIIIVVVRMRPAIKRFMKERAVKKAAEARKPKTLKLAHGAEHYRQARKAGEVAEDLSKDIGALEKALRKLK